jgi:predicted RNA polymerase sigma factor
VLDGVDPASLGRSPLVASVRGDLLERAGRPAEAAEAFADAATRAGNNAERAILKRRAEHNRRAAP